jgi:hypothetical protein
MDAIRRMLCAALTDRNDQLDWSRLAADEWRSLLELAQADGVLPLLYHTFDSRHQLDQLPADLRRALQLGYYAAVAQSSLIYGELKRVLGALQPVTPVVVLKGAALGPTIYPAAALRPLSDIDLLIPEQHLPAATLALRSLGYQDMPELTPGLNRVVEYHTQLQGGPSGRVTVELHWRLVAGAADWRSPPQDWFWQQLAPWQPDSDAPTVRQLTPTAHLLYLAAHLVLQHGSTQARLIWLYDLHLLIEQRGTLIQWDTAIEQARAFRWAAALHTALVAAREHLGTPLPEDVLDALQSASDQSARAFVEQQADIPPTAIMNEWIKLRSLQPRARARFIWSLICPSPTYLRWRYQPRPRWIWPVYLLFHWLRIVGAGLQIAYNRLRQRRSKNTCS